MIFVVSRMDCVQYSASPDYGDELAVCSVVELRAGGKCVIFHEELRRQEEVLAGARISVFCINATTKEPIALPDDVLQGLTPHIAK